jgi:hypothetical protein
LTLYMTEREALALAQSYPLIYRLDQLH